MRLYRCNGSHRKHTLGHSHLVQTLVAALRHVDGGNSVGDLLGVALHAGQNAAGSPKGSLVAGGSGKLGGAFHQRATPVEGLCFTQYIGYDHVMKQLFMHASTAQNAFRANDPLRPANLTERQARSAVLGLRESLTRDCPYLSFSEDLELSVTFGGPGFNREFYTLPNFLTAVFNQAELVRQNYLVEQVAVVPERVWKGVARDLCSFVLGDVRGVPAVFRDQAVPLSAEGLHAFAFVLDSVGLSFQDLGYWRAHAYPIVSTAAASVGRFRFFDACRSLDPSRPRTIFDLFPHVRLFILLTRYCVIQTPLHAVSRACLLQVRGEPPEPASTLYVPWALRLTAPAFVYGSGDRFCAQVRFPVGRGSRFPAPRGRARPSASKLVRVSGLFASPLEAHCAAVTYLAGQPEFDSLRDFVSRRGASLRLARGDGMFEAYASIAHETAALEFLLRVLAGVLVRDEVYQWGLVYVVVRLFRLSQLSVYGCVPIVPWPASAGLSPVDVHFGVFRDPPGSESEYADPGKARFFSFVDEARVSCPDGELMTSPVSALDLLWVCCDVDPLPSSPPPPPRTEAAPPSRPSAPRRARAPPPPGFAAPSYPPGYAPPSDAPPRVRSPSPPQPPRPEAAPPSRVSAPRRARAPPPPGFAAPSYPPGYAPPSDAPRKRARSPSPPSPPRP